MVIARIIMGALLGGCFGYATARFLTEGNWGMASLTIGICISVFYLAFWMVEVK